MMTALNKVAPSPPLPLLRMMVVNNSDLTNKQLFSQKQLSTTLATWIVIMVGAHFIISPK